MVLDMIFTVQSYIPKQRALREDKGSVGDAVHKVEGDPLHLVAF